MLCLFRFILAASLLASAPVFADLAEPRVELNSLTAGAECVAMRVRETYSIPAELRVSVAGFRISGIAYGSELAGVPVAAVHVLVPIPGAQDYYTSGPTYLVGLVAVGGNWTPLHEYPEAPHSYTSVTAPAVSDHAWVYGDFAQEGAQRTPASLSISSCLKFFRKAAAEGL